MRLFLVVMVSVSFLKSAAHDLRIAYFEISKKEAGYELVVRFDRQDILKELGAFSELDVALTSYLASHLSLLFDGEKVNWQVNDVTMDQLFIQMKCSLQTRRNQVSTINVWNTCLIDAVEKHDNIVISQLHGRSRSFRLNRKREQTIIKY